MIKTAFLIFSLIGLTSMACINNNSVMKNKELQSDKFEKATFGAGCFWCVEAIFSELKGVEEVLPGYTGGEMENPDYKSVCNGTTGHAEVCQIYFDPQVISFEELLEVLWTTHDPTTLDRQGNDVGTQYRSAIFYNDDLQKKLAIESKKNVATKIWTNPIVTEISPLGKFYFAEDYHNDYFANNSNQGYCRVVIEPKVLKFRKQFKDKLKTTK